MYGQIWYGVIVNDPLALANEGRVNASVDAYNIPIEFEAKRTPEVFTGVAT